MQKETTVKLQPLNEIKANVLAEETYEFYSKTHK